MLFKKKKLGPLGHEVLYCSKKTKKQTFHNFGGGRGEKGGRGGKVLKRLVVLFFFEQYSISWPRGPKSLVFLEQYSTSWFSDLKRYCFFRTVQHFVTFRALSIIKKFGFS